VSSETTPTVEVQGYELALDRGYEPATHIWVLVVAPDRVRLGMDPLGVETGGTLAQLALVPVGTDVRRGEPLGSVEAEKFVGPLRAPISGTVVAQNSAAVADPGLVHRDPLGAGWLVDLAPSDLDAERALLIEGAEQVVPWFEHKIAEYRLKGVLAE
jgi:glycine cleavage system H protein